MKMKKRIFTTFAIAASLFAGQILLPLVASAAPAPPHAEVCSGIEATGTTSCADTGQVTSIIKTIVNILSIIVGVAAVIMIIVGGLKYVTSGGESSAIASAKSTILYAIVGLVIAALAQFLVKFVLGRVT
jgi:L-fucose isomerase-like protein